MFARASTLVLLGCIALAAPGCVLTNDTDEPLLSVDLYWDESGRADRLVGGDCDSAGVKWMSWRLRDAHGKIVKQSPRRGERCYDAFDFVDLDPGEYELLLQGWDDADADISAANPGWETTCTGLVLERFDALYACEIEQ